MQYFLVQRSRCHEGLQEEDEEQDGQVQEAGELRCVFCWRKGSSVNHVPTWHEWCLAFPVLCVDHVKGCFFLPSTAPTNWPKKTHKPLKIFSKSGGLVRSTVETERADANIYVGFTIVHETEQEPFGTPACVHARLATVYLLSTERLRSFLCLNVRTQAEAFRRHQDHQSQAQEPEVNRHAPRSQRAPAGEKSNHAKLSTTSRASYLRARCLTRSLSHVSLPWSLNATPPQTKKTRSPSGSEGQSLF